MITKDELAELLDLKHEGFTLDYKEELELGFEQRNAEFIKDVLALANSGSPSYIITGVKDKTWEPAGISKSYSQTNLNQILQNRTDPPIKVEYAEIEINGLTHGIVKILGENPPYVVMVKDKYGNIQRGTVYIRNFDMNEGARRADLDKMYATPQADLQLGYDPVKKKSEGKLWEATISFFLLNSSKLPAIDPYVWIRFHNIDKVVKCAGKWVDSSDVNRNMPTINLHLEKPLYPDIRMRYGSVVVKIGKENKQIQTEILMMAVNVKRKLNLYFINL